MARALFSVLCVCAWRPRGRIPPSRGGISAAATSHPTVVRAALLPEDHHIIVIELENEGYQTTFGPGRWPRT